MGSLKVLIGSFKVLREMLEPLRVFPRVVLSLLVFLKLNTWGRAKEVLQGVFISSLDNEGFFTSRTLPEPCRFT